MTARPRSAAPSPLGELVRGQIRALGLERRMREEAVLEGWGGAVGPALARHTQPVRLEGGRLTLMVESPVWSHQLTLLKPDLLARIAAGFGAGLVTDLYFVTGRLERHAAPPVEPGPRRAAAALPPGLDEDLRAIPDHELREAVRRLCRAALGRGGG